MAGITANRAIAEATQFRAVDAWQPARRPISLQD